MQFSTCNQRASICLTLLKRKRYKKRVAWTFGPSQNVVTREFKVKWTKKISPGPRNLIFSSDFSFLSLLFLFSSFYAGIIDRDLWPFCKQGGFQLSTNNNPNFITAWIPSIHIRTLGTMLGKRFAIRSQPKYSRNYWEISLVCPWTQETLILNLSSRKS